MTQRGLRYGNKYQLSEHRRHSGSPFHQNATSMCACARQVSYDLHESFSIVFFFFVQSHGRYAVAARYVTEKSQRQKNEKYAEV